MQNFSFPYFSRDIAEFWRRWHISLSTWFRDYVYIPLGGSRVSKLFQLRNIFVIFLVSGFWHGANWTFLFWGLIHALCYLPLVLLKKNRSHLGIAAEHSMLPSISELFHIAKTFAIVTVAWVFFRADNIGSGVMYIVDTFRNLNIDNRFLHKIKIDHYEMSLVLFFILIMIVVEWVNRKEDFGLAKVPKNRFVRTGIYFLLTLVVLQYLNGESEFIYFQF